MNARAYFLLLRPWWSLSWCVLACLEVLMIRQSDWPLAWWVSIGVIAPYILGASIAFGVHAAMHRPFFPLLPDAGRKLLAPTVISLVIVIVITAAITAWKSRVSASAQLGLSATLAALPLANPRRGKFQLAPMVLCFAIFAVPRPFEQAMLAAPWGVSAGGLALACVLVRIGFDARLVRWRACIPFNSVPPTFFALANGSATRRYIGDFARDRAAAGAVGVMNPNRAWNVRRVADSTWSWMRVIWHTVGSRRPYPWSQVSLGCLFALETAALPLLGFLRVNGHDARFTMADYWRVLASLDSRDASGGVALDSSTFVGMPLAASGLFAVMLSLQTIYPRSILPISRKRRAQVSFGMAVVQITAATLAFGVVSAGMSLLGQYMSGHFVGSFGMRAGFGVVFGVAPVTCFVAMTRAVTSGFVRIAMAGVGGAAGLVIGLTRSTWEPALFTPVGVVVHVGVIAAVCWALYGALVWHYRRCDLVQELRMGAIATGH